MNFGEVSSNKAALTVKSKNEYLNFWLKVLNLKKNLIYLIVTTNPVAKSTFHRVAAVAIPQAHRPVVGLVRSGGSQWRRLPRVESNLYVRQTHCD